MATSAAKRKRRSSRWMSRWTRKTRSAAWSVHALFSAPSAARSTRLESTAVSCSASPNARSATTSSRRRSSVFLCRSVCRALSAPRATSAVSAGGWSRRSSSSPPNSGRRHMRGGAVCGTCPRPRVRGGVTALIRQDCAIVLELAICHRNGRSPVQRHRTSKIKRSGKWARQCAAPCATALH